MMKLYLLGTGTAIPRIDRNSSSCLVVTDDANILIDAGPSIVRRLLETGYDVNDIDIVIITHFHVDHTADLSTFFFACNYGMRPRKKPLTVIGGRGVSRFYRGLCAIYPWIRPNYYDLAVSSLVNESFQVKGLAMKTVQVNHNPESIAVRFDKEKSITFSGDTDYSRNLIKLADRTDMLVVECSFPERKVKGHLNLDTLDRMVRKALPKHVIVTHLYPDWDDFRGVLHHPYLLGEDGMEIEL